MAKRLPVKKESSSFKKAQVFPQKRRFDPNNRHAPKLRRGLAGAS